jgi:DNA-directed RNA polymerase specialized sigma subunit
MDFEYTQKSVQGILERYRQLQALRDRGNVDAIITLLDINYALKTIKFSMRQKQVLKLHYLSEYTVKETATKLRISEPTVVEYKKEIAKKVCSTLMGGVKRDILPR